MLDALMEDVGVFTERLWDHQYCKAFMTIIKLQVNYMSQTSMLRPCERVWMAYMEGQECNPRQIPPCAKGISHMSK